MAKEVTLLGFWASPFVFRVKVALQQKGVVDYEYIEEDIFNKSPRLLELNPVYKKVPVFIHGEKVVNESLIILEYIDETWQQNPLLPRDPYQRAMARFWAKYSEELMLKAFMALVLKGEAKEKNAKEFAEGLEKIEGEFKGKSGLLFAEGEGNIGYLELAFGWILYWLPVWVTKRPPSVSLQTGTVTTLQSLDLIELNYFKLSKASSAFVFFQRNPPKRERKKPFFLTQYFSLFLTLALPIVQRYLFSSARVGALKMAATAACSLQMAAVKPCISSSHRGVKAGVAVVGGNSKGASWTKLSSASHISSGQPFLRSFTSSSVKFDKVVTRAMAESSTNKPISGLPIDLKGKRAFIAGVADDNGYGWAIAKSLAAAGAEILVGTWVPALNIFETSLRRGKFDESRVLPDGSLMEITKIYPLDAIYDKLEDVPEDVKSNKRYSGSSKWTVQECAESVKQDFGSIDILVHSLANGPEVSKPLLETSRNGYLAALSASSYSYVSLLKHFIPLMNPGGSSLSLTYIASERIIPGYGGGMSSAKAALESDTRVLAFEAGRKHRIRVNAISAGPLRSRAAKAIGFIDTMIEYSLANAPLQKELSADEVGNTAAFLASPLASAITGAVIYVDNGLNAMGVGVDSPIFKDLDIPTDKH